MPEFDGWSRHPMGLASEEAPTAGRRRPAGHCRLARLLGLRLNFNLKHLPHGGLPQAACISAANTP